MNNIKNTMCRLADLTQEQINSLVAILPHTRHFTFGDREVHIGFHKAVAGTWFPDSRIKIVTYTEMMQLLGATDMNKKTAQEQLTAMQVEMDKLKAIINTPEVKTGRVMEEADLERNTLYYTALHTLVSPVCASEEHSIDSRRIVTGTAFHDKETADKYFEYLKLEQELRIAQAADGGGDVYKIGMNKKGELISVRYSDFYHKITFNKKSSLDAFTLAHTDEQLTLLIRGV